jgi:SAM-dependent methyltransferase
MTHPHAHSEHPAPPAPGDPAAWDERYASAEQVWSGDPNGALVAEVGELAPGTALDVGCGEGADAVWLARRGWQVTALDVSAVALERARRHADDAGVTVTWLHSGLEDADLPAFDLVSAQYAALLGTPGHDAERALLGAVAPGGVLLVVHHAVLDGFREHGVDPADYVLPPDLAARLEDDDEWQVEVFERRTRSVSGGAGAGHTEDVVLRARRSTR